MILPASEKKSIVEQHLKNVAYSEYNLTLSINEANAVAEINQPNLDSLNSQLSDILAQKAVLQQELDLVNAEIAQENLQA
jgi:hypothetical protein